MKTKGSPGSDDIPPSFLKALRPLALTELLGVLNISFWSGECASIWRCATIVPLLKSGRDASLVSSYRPISLTSCVVRLLERMIADRLYYLAESKDWLHRMQVGFRKNRSGEDQVLRIVQSVEDAVQTKPTQCSVLGLLDFSQAYDCVWKERLLLSMRSTGVFVTFTRWLRSFLSDRRAVVRRQNTKSRSVRLVQGLSQGSLLALLMFSFYINTLTDTLPGDVRPVIFADNFSILGTNADKQVAEASVQQAINVVVVWSKTFKLKINPNKSEAAFFSSWSHNAAWKPKRCVEDVPSRFNPHPRLLGIKLDRTLSFNAHEDLVTKTTPALRMQQGVGVSKWSWHPKNLWRTIFALIRSRLDYAAAAWQRWLSTTNMDRLDHHYRAANIYATGSSSSRNKHSELSYPKQAVVHQSPGKSKMLARPPKSFGMKQQDKASQQGSNLLALFYHLAENLPLKEKDRAPLPSFKTPPWHTSNASTTRSKDQKIPIREPTSHCIKPKKL